MQDPWYSGTAYEQFMGRWSALVARKFLDWLAAPAKSRWLEVGCGTGALTRLILETQQPKDILAIDASNEFIAHARRSIAGSTVQFKVGFAQSLELETNSIDVVVSGLMLNFVPQPQTAVEEMRRVTRRGGKIGIYVWDYAQGMQMLRYFWDAAVALDERARQHDEGVRFPMCQEGQLEAMFQKAGLKQVETIPIEVGTIFQNFEEYWQPFLGNVGPAPSYTMGLAQADREKLAEKLRGSLPVDEKGTISLMARAWAVQGTA